jgi:integrase
LHFNGSSLKSDIKGGLKGGYMARRARDFFTARGVVAHAKKGYTADGAVAGLNLQVSQGVDRLSKSWVFRYTSPTTKKRREMGLGAFADLSLAKARDKARELRGMVLEGIDPKEQRDAEQNKRWTDVGNRMTFENAAMQCIATKSHEWNNAKHKSQWSATLATFAFPVIGRKRVSDISMEDVLKVLEPIWTHKTVTATRVRQRIETVMDWAKAHKLFAGENPASLKSGLCQLLPKASKLIKVKHHPALPFSQAYEFVRALRQIESVPSQALEFLMLTATRSGEVIGAQWSELDLEHGVWVIPANRMKAGREHRVPLCKRALCILKDMLLRKQSDYVFTDASGTKRMSHAAMLVTMKKISGFDQFVPHGLRSTFRDWASETTHVANETLELALSHTIRNQAEAAYRRGDQLEKRAKLMQLWQNFVESPPVACKVRVMAKLA